METRSTVSPRLEAYEDSKHMNVIHGFTKTYMSLSGLILILDELPDSSENWTGIILGKTLASKQSNFGQFLVFFLSHVAICTSIKGLYVLLYV